MKQIRYDDGYFPLLKAYNSHEPTIFLAGPTVRANQDLITWRNEALALLSNHDVTVIVPEFYNDKEWALEEKRTWIMSWELMCLTNADVILFWIPRQMPKLPGLTTNVEFGYWLSKRNDRIVYGRPRDAHKTNYLDFLWYQEKDEVIHDNLEDTIKSAVSFAEALHQTPGYKFRVFTQTCQYTIMDLMAKNKWSDQDVYDLGLTPKSLKALLSNKYDDQDIMALQKMLKKLMDSEKPSD